MKEVGETGGRLVLLQGAAGPAPETAWVLVQTNARAERLAASHLRRIPREDGVAGVYVPMRASKSKRADAARSTPMFPGYVFLSVEVARAPWSTIASTVGVGGLLQVAGSICRVPTGEVERLRSREVMGLVELGDVRPAGSGPTFTKGERLRIAKGDLAGFEVVFDRHLSDAARTWVLLEFCGGLRTTEVRAANLSREAS